MQAHGVLENFKLFSGWLVANARSIQDADVVLLHDTKLESGISSEKKIIFVPAEPIVVPLHKELKFDVSENVIEYSFDFISASSTLLSYRDELGSQSYGNYFKEDVFSIDPERYQNPYLNRYFNSLLSGLHLLLQQQLWTRNAHPENKPFSLALSHDVDYLNSNVLTITKLLRNYYKAYRSSNSTTFKHLPLLRYCLNRNHIDLYRIAEIEQTVGVRSSLNISAYRANPEDNVEQRLLNPHYDMSDLDIAQLEAQGFEIALHGSLAGFDSSQRFADEVSRVRESAPCVGGRQHFLACSFPETFQEYERNGFLYDTSMGFNDFNGFRNSTGFVHRPLDLDNGGLYKFFEIPLVFMDSVFTKRGIVDPEIISAEAQQLANSAQDLSISASVCWHDVAFRRTSQMAQAYEEILDVWKQAGAYLGAPEDLARFHASVVAIEISNKGVHISEEIPGGLFVRRGTGGPVQQIENDGFISESQISGMFSS